MTPITDWGLGLIGGAMIGAAALMLMGLLGRIAGISGILGTVIDRLTAGVRDGDAKPGLSWRLHFLIGLVIGPLLLAALRGGEAVPIRLDVGWPLLILGGLLVGFGTRMGAGCTSGHGVCGLARLSVRSVVATALFFAAALITVFVTRHLLGLGG